MPAGLGRQAIRPPTADVAATSTIDVNAGDGGGHCARRPPGPRLVSPTFMHEGPMKASPRASTCIPHASVVPLPVRTQRRRAGSCVPANPSASSDPTTTIQGPVGRLWIDTTLGRGTRSRKLEVIRRYRLAQDERFTCR